MDEPCHPSSTRKAPPASSVRTSARTSDPPSRGEIRADGRIRSGRRSRTRNSASPPVPTVPMRHRAGARGAGGVYEDLRRGAVAGGESALALRSCQGEAASRAGGDLHPGVARGVREAGGFAEHALPAQEFKGGGRCSDDCSASADAVAHRTAPALSASSTSEGVGTADSPIGFPSLRLLQGVAALHDACQLVVQTFGPDPDAATRHPCHRYRRPVTHVPAAHALCHTRTTGTDPRSRPVVGRSQPHDRQRSASAARAGRCY